LADSQLNHVNNLTLAYTFFQTDEDDETDEDDDDEDEAA
jgi:cytochrome c oxidase assembly protein Cox11